jgi:perosamine synthetase
MIPIFKPHIYDKSKEYAKLALDNGDIAQGPFIKQFEDSFASKCDRSYGVTCSNGTVALYMAIRALNLPRGTEVIVPSMTIVSCLTAITENGLIPVFCDIDPKTYNIDFNSAQSKVSTNTSAIIIINIYGLLVDVDQLRVFQANNPNIKVIEDASESHGAIGAQTKAGSLGDVSTFSFYTNKIVTMGEGGIVLTNDPTVYERLMQIRNLHFTDRRKYIHEAAGFNFRLTNLQCAIGLGQLAHIDETIEHRKRVAYSYNKHFANTESIQTPVEPEGYSNVYWYYGILVDNQNSVLNALEENEIEYRHFFHPLHKQPFINSSETLINSEKCFENGILLPIFNELSEEQIQFIATTIKQAI